MTSIGAIALAIAASAAVLSLRRDSRVGRLMGALVPRRVGRAPKVAAADLGARVVWALVGALGGSAISVALPLGGAPIALLAYAGWVLPSVHAERQAARRRREAEDAVVSLVEWLHALVSSGRPPEAAITEIAARGAVDRALAAPLERVRRDYLLGVPLHVALARVSASDGVRALGELGACLEQARDLGRGVLPLLQELRDDLRSRQRSRILGDASAVEGKLTLVMTLCYLPALALLVIVPLFMTLLAGLFAP